MVNRAAKKEARKKINKARKAHMTPKYIAEKTAKSKCCGKCGGISCENVLVVTETGKKGMVHTCK